MKGIKIAAIDVGTTKVCTIMATHDTSSGLRVVGVGVAPSHGVEKGLVVDIDQAKESIRESISKAQIMAGYKLESACIGVTGRHISSMNSRGAVAITRSDQLVRTADLKRVMEVALNVESSSERKLLHVIPRSYTLDGQEVKNPVGMHGYDLNVEAHVVTGAAASIQNLTKCIMRIGIDIDDLVLEPIASAEAVLTEEEKQKGVLVADIGGGTTNIAVIKNGIIYHASVLPVAGNQITHDIALGMGLSSEIAEEMKRKYASLLPSGEVADTGISISGDVHTLSSRDLSDIAYARVEELLRLILLELPHHDYVSLIPAGIVLTGGTANIPGIAELAGKVSKLPVRVGTPVSLYGVGNKILNDPAYATSVGLLLWETKNEGALKWPIQSSGIRHFFSEVLGIFR